MSRCGLWITWRDGSDVPESCAPCSSLKDLFGGAAEDREAYVRACTHNQSAGPACRIWFAVFPSGWQLLSRRALIKHFSFSDGFSCNWADEVENFCLNERFCLSFRALDASGFLHCRSSTTAGTFDVHNPATGKLIASLPEDSQDQVKNFKWKDQQIAVPSIKEYLQIYDF